MPRKYRSQPVNWDRLITDVMQQFPKTRAALHRSEQWDDWDGVSRPLTEPTVYEIDPADHWQKLGILGPDGRPIEYYAGPDTLGFLFRDEDSE
jgi:hypothetical protein